MIIEVNTDNHVQGDERLHEYTETTVRGAVDRFASQITRLEEFAQLVASLAGRPLP